MRLIDNWRECYRWASMRAMTAAGAVQATWLALPDDLRATVPHNLVTGITIALLVLGLVGRLVDQTKPAP